MINIKYFDPNKIRIDEKPWKGIVICYIKYETTKDCNYETRKSVNPLHNIINKINGWIEESNGNKYLTLVSTDENKERLKSVNNYRTKSETLSCQ